MSILKQSLAVLLSFSLLSSAQAAETPLHETALAKNLAKAEIGWRTESGHQTLDEKTAFDLEMPALIQKMQGYAVTDMAKARIAWLLNHPYIEAQEIEQRQAAIAAIANDDAAFETLDRIFSQINQMSDMSAERFMSQFRRIPYLPPPDLTMLVLFSTLIRGNIAELPHQILRIGAALQHPVWATLHPMLLGLGLNFASMVWFSYMTESQRLPTEFAFFRARQAGAAGRPLNAVAEQSAALREIQTQCASARKCSAVLDFIGTLSPRMNKIATRISYITGIPYFTSVVGRGYLQFSQESATKMLAAMAELETYYAFAKYYREHKDVLSFPKVLQQKWARLEIKDGYHPYQILQRGGIHGLIPNSLELDEDKTHHSFIITGPNAGGKTTFQQMYLLNTVMAQVGLPVPVRSMEFTPFYVFTNFTRNTSALEDGKSTFFSQSERVAQMLRFVETSRPALTAFDEILTGTSDAEHQAIERAALRTFHESNGVLTTIATHERDLTSFADEMPGVGNLQVSLDGHVVLPGASESYNAFAVAEGAGVPVPLLRHALHYFREANPKLADCKGLLLPPTLK
jgi:hypothetical protein